MLELGLEEIFDRGQQVLWFYLVRVDGHTGRQANHWDPVETGSVGDRCGSQVVIGLRGVTDQNGVNLQDKRAHMLDLLKVQQHTRDPEGVCCCKVVHW